MSAKMISEGIYWVGVQDLDLRVFDIIMETKHGTSYNSYLVQGQESTVLIETVKEKFFDAFLQNLQEVVNVADIDYLIVNHTEPDHTGSVEQLLRLNPQMKVLGTQSALEFLKEIVNQKIPSQPVSHGEVLKLGGRSLQFIHAPFLHWPDSMFTYLPEEGILFPCDAFGSHYADERVFNDLLDTDADHLAAYADYYQMIMGPFKPYVLEALEKIKDLPLNLVCPGHGPILRQNISQFLDLYQQWSEPAIPTNALPKVVVPYVSAYGYTRQIGEMIIEGIQTVGEFNVQTYDLAETDTETVLQELTGAAGLVVGSCTINGDALPPIWDLLTRLSPIVHHKLLATAFGAYGWSGEAVPNIEQRLRSLRMEVRPGIKVNFRPSDADMEQIFTFGMDFGKALLEKNLPQSEHKWRCIICGYIHQGEVPPVVCPACGVGAENFVSAQSEEEFSKDTQEKFVIVGGGIAGHSAAKAVRERNATAEIALFTEEELPTYFRPLLSDLLTEEEAEANLLVVAGDWYQEQKITLHTGTEISAINTTEKTVTTTAGANFPYDKLILATGARSKKVDIPGMEKEQIFTLRSLSDARKIRQAMAGAQKALVLGGGILGLEVAWEMIEAGLAVTVVEIEPSLMPQQLDAPSGRRLQGLIEEKGVQLYLGYEVQEIIGETQAQGVRLDSGDILEADLIFISAGIEPNVEVAAAAGITAKNGIKVDKQMRTSAANVYAAGDGAKFEKQQPGLWPLAMEMGRIAGAAAAGDWVEYKEPKVPTLLLAFGKEVFSIGEVNWSAGSCRIVEVTDPIEDYYKKSFFQDGVLRGEIIIAEKAQGLESMQKIGRDASGTLRHSKWKCKVCGYIHEGPEPPDVCPICGAGKEAFEPID